MKSVIVVRFTDSHNATDTFRDLEIPVSINLDKDDVNRLVTTAWLKQQIRCHCQAANRRRVRLIYSGRVLNELTRFKEDIFLPRISQAENSGDSEPIKIYIHCLIGDELTSKQLREEKELDARPQEVSTAPQVVGFDRLLQQGFSHEDVEDLRTQFREIYLPDALRNLNGGDVTDVEEEETRQQVIRQLEERWIESTINGGGNNDSGGTGAASGDDDQGVIAPTIRALAELEELNHNEDLVLGLLIGGFLGVVALVFLFLDSSFVNKDRRWAIYAGVMANFFYAVLRGQWI